MSKSFKDVLSQLEETKKLEERAPQMNPRNSRLYDDPETEIISKANKSRKDGSAEDQEILNVLSFMTKNQKDRKMVLSQLASLSPAKKKRLSKKAAEFYDMYSNFIKGRM